MTINEQLHSLIDGHDDRASAALAYIRDLAGRTDHADVSIDPESWSDWGPVIMSGAKFRTWSLPDLETLAAQQGVKPIESIDDLRGDFWPEDESIDEFIATVREWRREGGCG